MSKINPSRLWLARKRLGFEQKQIAQLLAQKNVNPISRYENGNQVPNLKTAIKLSIIYKLPIRVLFSRCYRECFDNLVMRAKKSNQNTKLKFDLTEPTDYCAYLELLKTNFLNGIEEEKIRRHTLILMNQRNKTDQKE